MFNNNEFGYLLDEALVNSVFVQERDMPSDSPDKKSYLLQEDGGGFLLEDGSGFILLE